jgi:hypothetical protein
LSPLEEEKEKKSGKTKCERLCAKEKIYFLRLKEKSHFSLNVRTLQNIPSILMNQVDEARVILLQ